MQTVAAQVGTSRILVEASEVALPEGYGTGGRYGTQQTGVAEDLRDAYGQLKDLLHDLADDLGQELAVPRPHWPSEVKVQLGLSFSTSGNVWVVKATGEMTCTVTMTWCDPGAERRPGPGPGSAPVPGQ